MADEQKNVADEAEVMPVSQENISPVESMEETKPVEEVTEPTVINSTTVETQEITETSPVADAQASIISDEPVSVSEVEVPDEAIVAEETLEPTKQEEVVTEPEPVIEASAIVIDTPQEAEAPIQVEEVPKQEAAVVEAIDDKKPEAGYEKAKVKSNTIISIVVVLLAVLGLVFWLTKDGKENDIDADNPNGKIVVSDAPEQGKVTIIEEVKDQLRVASGGTATFNNTNPNSAKMAVTVFVGNTRKNPNSADCAQVYPVNRQAEKRYESNMINTVLSLLEPISATEKESGYISIIPAGTFLQYIKIDDSGVATANFSGTISKVAGSCAVTAIKSQIKNTLIQFASVKSVVICIDGNCNQAEILQP